MAKPMFLSSGKVAQRLGISRQTVGRLAEANVLPCYRLPSGQYRIRAAAVEQLIQGREHDAQAKAAKQG